MPPVDGATYKLPRAFDRVMIFRGELWMPVRPVVNFDPENTHYEGEPQVVNCPFGWRRARGLDETQLAGRLDQDLVFTTEILFFPYQAPIDQGWIVKDTTIRADGTNARNYGRFFVLRGNPSIYEALPGSDLEYLAVAASVEAIAPPGVT